MGLCSVQHRRRYIQLVLLSCVMIAAAAAYLFTWLQSLRKAMICAVDRLWDLRKEKASSPIGAYLESIDKDRLELIRNHVHYFDFYVCIGLPTAVVLLLLAMACLASRPSPRYRILAPVMVLTCLLLLAYVAFHLGACTLSLTHDRPLFTDRWDEVTEFCPRESLTLATSVADARMALREAQVAGGAVSAPNATLNSLLETQREFTELCGCLDDVPGALGNLAGPGAAGVFAGLLGLFALGGVSRTTGCCRKPRSKRVEPDGDAATDGAKGGATKDEEEGDDDESEEESSED